MFEKADITWTRMCPIFMFKTMTKSTAIVQKGNINVHLLRKKEQL